MAFIKCSGGETKTKTLADTSFACAFGVLQQVRRYMFNNAGTLVFLNNTSDMSVESKCTIDIGYMYLSSSKYYFRFDMTGDYLVFWSDGAKAGCYMNVGTYTSGTTISQTPKIDSGDAYVFLVARLK